jgi:hypothetical protein
MLAHGAIFLKCGALKIRGDFFFPWCFDLKFQSESESLDISQVDIESHVQPYFSAVALPQNTRYMNTV